MWRKWLSLKLLSLYLQNKAYYKINNANLIDNPDQRIVEDIRSFTSLSLSFLLIIFNSIIALFAFMSILWSISINLTIVAVIYAAIGSLITYFLGRPLVGLNFQQLRKEADYRYKLINIRDNAESIAFYRGEKKENTRARQKLKIAVTNLKSIISWNRNLGFFTTGYNYFVTILPTIVVAPLYLDGKIEFGVVTQAGFAFSQVLGALSIIVLNFGGLSTFGAVVSRLGTFWEVVTNEAQNEESPIANDNFITYKVADEIKFESVTLYTPRSRQTVFKELSFEITKGQGVLICGASGSGKSSTLRALAGLWASGSGLISRPEIDKIMFIPQRPYMILGTLRSQLLYGQNTDSFMDSELEEVAKKVGLKPLIDRVGGLDAIMDWQSILSTGEQQKLAIARALLAKPEFIFLDEATTAVEDVVEKDLYCKVLANVKGFASVGHRHQLEQFHHTILTLKGDGTYNLEKNNNALNVCLI